MTQPAVNAILIACLAGHALWVAFEPVTASDLWWALAAGRWILEHRSIPTVDVFSYSVRGTPWFNQEWLSQVFFQAVWERADGAGLAMFRIVAVVSTFGLVAAVATRRSGSLALAVLSSCAAAFACRPFLDIRSQLFTFPAAIAVLGLLQAYRGGASARLLAFIPCLIALWVNLHYGFIYGIGMCGLFALTEASKTFGGLPEAALAPHRLVPLAVLALAALAAGLLNPQGLHALTFPFEILDQASWRREIIEWTPPVIFGSESLNPLAFSWLLLAHIVLAGAALAVAGRRFDVSDAALTVVTAAMALASRRFIPLFALVAVPFMARNLALLGERALQIGPSRQRVATAFVAAMAIVHVAWRLVPDVRGAAAQGVFAYMARTAYFPAAAAEFLRLNPQPARLFNLYTWSGYLLFTVPERPVLIDGRAHQVYPEQLWRESFSVELGRPGWEATLAKHEVSLVLWLAEASADGGFRALFEQLQASPAWVRVFTDGQAAIYAHAERGREWVDAYRAVTLRYPDVADAQLFLGEAMLAAGELPRAYQHFRDAFTRHSEMRDFFRDVLARNLGERANATGDPSLWFQLAFVRDVLGEHAGAAEAYRASLAAGLLPPLAPFAEEALARLAPRS